MTLAVLILWFIARGEVRRWSGNILWWLLTAALLGEALVEAIGDITDLFGGRI